MTDPVRNVLVETFIAGLPKTKGSLTVRPNLSVRDTSASSTWRALMAGEVGRDYRARWAAARCTGHGLCSHPRWFVCGQPVPYEGPVAVAATFYLPVDPIAYAAGDLDKLLRNLLDAIAADARNPKFNGGVIRNDNQVVVISAVKHGPPIGDQRAGVRVKVTALDVAHTETLRQSPTHGRLDT